MSYYIEPYPEAVAWETPPMMISCTEDRLAHLLFESDETVRESIAVADDRGGGSFLRTREGAYAIEREELYKRAWDRNEKGRRKWAEQMAARMFSVSLGR